MFFTPICNVITSVRIICSIFLIFCKVFSFNFYLLYIISGLSDIMDGYIARKTNTASEFGAVFDTIADFIFVIICLFKLIPILDIPIWIYIWICVIAFLKIFNIIYGYFTHKKFISIHSMINKITGIFLFCLPLTLTIFDFNYSSIIVCCIATFAALYEWYYIKHIKKKKFI